MAIQTRKKKAAPLGSDVVAEGSTPLHIQIRESIRSQVRDGKLIRTYDRGGKPGKPSASTATIWF